MSSPLIARVARNIKHERMKKRWTKEKLEFLTGLSIFRCESGKRDMTLTTIGILSEHLGVKPYQLLK